MAPEPVTIRPAVAADMGCVRAMLREFEEHLNTLADPEPIDESLHFRLDGLAFGPRPRCHVLLAESSDGAAAGYLIWFIGVFMDPVSSALFVADLYVRPSHRGTGLGRRLMEAAAGIGREEGADRLMWTVWRKNPAAIAFYRHLGAEPVEEELLMSWQLAVP